MAADLPDRIEEFMMFPFKIGNLAVDRVEELDMWAQSPFDFLVGLPDNAVQENRAWLVDAGFDFETGRERTTIQSWIVRTGRHTILIDSCSGNHKDRPDIPPIHQLDTPWLDRLADKGLAPEQIDFVMCTHLHADHVGWNTRLIDGRWVPTFPNARYIFARKEYDFWTSPGAAGWGQEGVFKDSVLPCVEAGLAEFVEDGFTVDECLQIEAAPGHSPGNVLIRARSLDETALFVGDCMHSPLQIVYPDVNSVACADQVMARATRHRVLAEAAEHRHLLIPGHFPPPYVCRVAANGDSYRYLPGL